jgi:hypothetical protein
VVVVVSIAVALTTEELAVPTQLATAETAEHLGEVLMAQLGQTQLATVLAVVAVVVRPFKAETQPAGLVGQVPQA